MRRFMVRVHVGERSPWSSTTRGFLLALLTSALPIVKVETMNTPVHDFPKEIGNPATNALLAMNITTVEQVAMMSDQELLAIHGVGPKALRVLKEQIRIDETLKRGSSS